MLVSWSRVSRLGFAVGSWGEPTSKAKYVPRLLALGLLGSIYAASSFIRFIFAPPTGDIIGVLGAGLAWGAYLAFSIFIIPGAILVRKHESFVRRAIGIIVILLGIIPQAVAYLHSTPHH
jgi:hypothetical protein